MVEATQRVSMMPTTQRPTYTARIIKASALLPDTRALLSAWDMHASVASNLDTMQRQNVIGTSSRSRLSDILLIFRQRYLADPAVLAGLVTLARAPLAAPILDTVLLHLTLRSDSLLAALVTEVVLPAYRRGVRDITPAQVGLWVRAQVVAGATAQPWGEATIERVVRNSIAALRDFGVLRGKLHKQIAAPLVPIEAFAFIALLRFRAGVVGERLLRDAIWSELLLDDLAVERLFVAAHQEQLLEFYAAGRVVRISFPTLSPEEYAHVLAQRAYRPA